MPRARRSHHNGISQTLWPHPHEASLLSFPCWMTKYTAAFVAAAPVDTLPSLWPVQVPWTTTPQLPLAGPDPARQVPRQTVHQGCIRHSTVVLPPWRCRSGATRIFTTAWSSAVVAEAPASITVCRLPLTGRGVPIRRGRAWTTHRSLSWSASHSKGWGATFSNWWSDLGADCTGLFVSGNFFGARSCWLIVGCRRN